MLKCANCSEYKYNDNHQKAKVVTLKATSRQYFKALKQDN